MARVPFAPLDNPRLQHLASAKNRQNGIITFPKDKSKPLTTKRPFELSTLDNFDGENVDPAGSNSPTKKSKGDGPFKFSLTPKAISTMPPPPSRVSTPVRANMSSARAPMTAPAGRSPKRKLLGGINKSRRTSAPFTRIDPPLFGKSAASSSTMPFSLDAALSGTFTTTPSAAAAKEVSAAATIQESMPQTWFFEIYEDTPEEEAGNLMEHSTLTLDLSSDDESEARERCERGEDKENMPPADYEAPAASRGGSASVLTRPTEIVRKKIVAEEMDDGQRSPLSDLETEPFIPEGLARDAYVLVLPTPEKLVAAPIRKDLFAAQPSKRATEGKKRSAAAALLDETEGEVKGEIVVWEDSAPAAEPSVTSQEGEKRTKVIEVCDENAAPVVNVVV